MARSLSQAFRDAYYRSMTDDLVLVLVIISHNDLPAPIRVVNNTQSVLCNGNTYLPFPISVTLPAQSEREQRAQLEVCNIDQSIIANIRSISSAPTVQILVVTPTDLGASPPEFNTIEVQTLPLTWAIVEYDLYKITGDIQGPALLNRKVPAHHKSPGYRPGLFKQ